VTRSWAADDRGRPGRPAPPLRQVRAADLTGDSRQTARPHREENPTGEGAPSGSGPGAEVPGFAPLLLGEAASAVGAVCVALHVATAVAPGHGDPLTRAVLLLMAAGCVPCVRSLWRAPTTRVWAMTGAMYAAMLTAHLLLLVPWVTPPSAHTHAGGASWTELGMWSGLALAGVETVLAAVVLLGARRRCQARSAGSGSVDAGWSGWSLRNRYQ
jgi:hypothetical protein